MKPGFLFFFSFLIVLTSCTQKTDNKDETVQGDKTKIIFDTDFGGDADDLGALAMLHHYADQGYIDLLAVMCWSNEKNAIPAIDAVNEFYGRPNLSIGVRKTDSSFIDWSYAIPIAEQFPHSMKSNREAPDAQHLYRSILSEAADSSIVIVTVGPLANIRNLLQSSPDSISRLSGKDLVHKKVKEFVIMGGKFPMGGTEDKTEWNFSGAMPGVTKYVLENIELPIIFTGFEVGVALKAGKEINEYNKNTPLYVGYKYFSEFAFWMKDKYEGEILDNSSFDQTAVMYASLPDKGMSGDHSFWKKSKKGICSATEKGTSGWEFDPNGNHTFLILNQDTISTARHIVETMMFK